MKIGFIGLGIMGSRMAKNLLKNGYDVTVYNRNIEKAEPLKEFGAKIADTVEECVADKDIIWSMLASPAVVEDLALYRKGFTKFMKKGSLWADSTTVNPSFARNCADKVEHRGIRYIDAPVAGTKPHAENAELFFMVGGEEKDVEEAKPLMNVMGNRMVRFGKVGQGSAFKILGNNLLAHAMVAFSECVALGVKMGLDKEMLIKNLAETPMAAPFLKFKADSMLGTDEDVQFPLELMQKDVNLVAQTAFELTQPMYSTNAVKEVFASAKEAGFSREDFSKVFKYLNK